jgi:signal peptidase complex subunit 1
LARGDFQARAWESRWRTWKAQADDRQIIAFLVGYMAQDIRLSLYVGLAGTALTFVVIVPPWPFFNKNPENWLPSRKATSGIRIDVDGKRVE